MPPSDLPASWPLQRDAGKDRGEGGWTVPLLAALAGAGGAWGLWRRARRNGRGEARSLDTDRPVRLSSHALTGQASLHAVQWKGQVLLLACTSQHVRVIARCPAAAAQGNDT